MVIAVPRLTANKDLSKRRRPALPANAEIEANKHDAEARKQLFFRRNQASRRVECFAPSLSPVERQTAETEGWILGIR